MGDVNQIIYLRRFVPTVNGPILEIGSKDYGNTSSFRDQYVGNEYVGVDMQAGKNVDRVINLAEGVGDLEPGHFALAICCSVLEHTKTPWRVAENITRLVRPEGLLYVSVPWVWRYHPYPDDYFRFSWRGIAEIFPRFTWQNVCYATNIPNEFFEIAGDGVGVDDRMAHYKQIPGGPRKYLPYLSVNMLGSRRAG